MRTERVLIMGAAGRDFHDFNVVYRDDPSVELETIGLRIRVRSGDGDAGHGFETGFQRGF